MRRERQAPPLLVRPQAMKLLPAPTFSRVELIFSVKVFVSAMLAVYLASACGLSRPFWAMLTCSIIAHPRAGAVQSDRCPNARER